MTTKSFDLSDILSVTTGRLVSTRHMDGIYDVVAWVAKDDGVTTLGLLYLTDKVKASILTEHPQLNEVTIPNWEGISREDIWPVINDWLQTQYAIYGENLELSQISDTIPYKSDLQIFAEVRGESVKQAAEKTIAVVVDSNPTT